MEIIEEKDLAKISSGSMYNILYSNQVSQQLFSLLLKLSNLKSRREEVTQALQKAMEDGDLRRIIPLRRQLNALLNTFEVINGQLEKFYKKFPL